MFSQEPCVGTCYTEEEEINIENYISTLEQKDSLNVIEISDLKEIIKLYEIKNQNDSLWIDLQNQKIDLLNNRVELYKDLSVEIQPKWYENRWLWFFGGIILTTQSIKLAGELSD